jgi:hypothetical protein
MASFQQNCYQVAQQRDPPLDAGHFAWEQASDEYGRLIVDSVTGGFQRS